VWARYSFRDSKDGTVSYDRAGDALWRISNKAWTLLQLMERYVNAAILQRSRLDQYNERFLELMSRGPSLTRLEVTEHMSQGFADVHFFLICGDKVHGLFEHMLTVEHAREIRTVWGKKRVKLEAFQKARDVLEHMDERVVKRGELNSGGSLMNGVLYSVGDQVIDVGPSALAVITSTYEELCDTAAALPHRPEEQAASEAGGPSISTPPITIALPETPTPER
jgi:hypothetical protein